MCNPMAIAGLVLTAGSTVANTMAANQQAKARASALEAERTRQRGLDQENEALNFTARERYSDFEGQQDERGSQLADYFTESEPEGAAAAGADRQAVDAMLPTNGSAVTVREAGKQGDLARAFTDQQGEALGQLRAFGDVMGTIGRAQARDAGLIGQINGFKRGSSGILPLELEAANQKGSGARMFGDILNLGGSFALNNGLQGGMVGLGGTAPDPWATMRSPTVRL